MSVSSVNTEMNVEEQENGYGLRPRTPISRVKGCGVARPRRAVLGAGRSASIRRGDNHTCHEVDSHSTSAKVHARMSFSIYRFGLSHALSCPTSRGVTQYNGDRNHCGQNVCEAGHAALSPTLYDEKLAQIEGALKDNPFDKLESIANTYFSHRFALTDKEKKELSSDSIDERMKSFHRIIKRASQEQRKGSIVGSEVEKLRNATYGNPQASNRIDSYLERVLRPVEDALSKECGDATKTLEEAALELQAAYQKALQQARQDLLDEGNRFERFERTWKNLIRTFSAFIRAPQDQQKEEYVQAIKEYQEAFLDKRRNKFGAAPSFKALLEYLNTNQSITVLQKVKGCKNTAEALQCVKQYKKYLQLPDIDKEREMFEQAHLQIEQRLREVEIQTKTISIHSDEVRCMIKALFGVKDASGELQLPSKEDIATHIISTLPQLIAVH